MAQLLTAKKALLDTASDAGDAGWQSRVGEATGALPVLTTDPTLLIQGTKSLLATKSTSAGTLEVQTIADDAATAASTYTFAGDLKRPDGAGNCKIFYEWFSGTIGAGVLIGANGGENTVSVGTTTTRVHTTAVALTGATHMRVIVRAEGMGANHRLVGDRFAFQLGTDATYPDVFPDPSASAGTDQSVAAGVQVTLNSTASAAGTGGNNITRVWSRNGGTGPTVTLSSTTAASPTYTATVTGTYIWRVTVTETETGQTDTDDVTITTTAAVGNLPPVVSAGPDLIGTVDVPITITGTDSDPDGTIVSREWTIEDQPVGSNIPFRLPVLPFTLPATLESGTLVGATTNTVTFTPDVPGDYTFRYTVIDDDAEDSFDEVTITAFAGAGRWTELAGSIVTPTVDAEAVLMVRFRDALEDDIHYLDTAALIRGITTIWTRGGLFTVFEVERSVSTDGGLTWGGWEPVRDAGSINEGEGGTASVVDFEGPPGLLTRYRARSRAEV